MIAAPKRISAAVAVALHASAIGALLAYEPARTALLSVTPIMVDWIAAPKSEPVAEPPKPRPVHRPLPRPMERTQIHTAPAESPSPILAPAPPPPPPEPVAAVEPLPVEVSPVYNAAYLQNPRPAYPTVSKRLREEGHVVLRVLVNPNGTAAEVQVRTSSGSPRLDASAVDTVKTIWKFVPARRGAEAVPAWVLIPFTFKLDG